jgi:aryl-alcohol dehydrogenase-like predicted oxidoreductase
MNLPSLPGAPDYGAAPPVKVAAWGLGLRPVIPQTEFGRTGHRSSRVIFGAAALSRMSQERTDELLQPLLDYGVNHLDTAAGYGDSELRLAPWLASNRDRFFVATKTGERSGAGARASLERSLERLGVDSVDLIQLHNLVEEEEWEVAHGPGGAVEALVRAREEGLVRFIGVTGHGLRIAGMHLRSLERFDADSVLLPYNFSLLADPGYRRDVEALRALCAERRVAVQTIKSGARRRWRDDATEARYSWYEPIRDEAAIGRSVRWVLAQEDLFLNTSSDVSLLPVILAAADAGGAAPSDEEMAADVEALGVEPIFDGGTLERI